MTCAWSSRTGATDYEPAFAAQGAPPATTQGDNNTSVQLVTLDAGGSAAGVDFGLIIPDQVIQPDAPIATVIQYAGDPNYTGPGSTADRPTLVAQPWSKVGSADTPATSHQRTELADFGQVGSAWGVSYNRVTNAMILAASLKRMSGFGDLGLGGIYRVPDVLLADGSIRAAPQPRTGSPCRDSLSTEAAPSTSGSRCWTGSPSRSRLPAAAVVRSGRLLARGPHRNRGRGDDPRR